MAKQEVGQGEFIGMIEEGFTRHTYRGAEYDPEGLRMAGSADNLFKTMIKEITDSPPFTDPTVMMFRRNRAAWRLTELGYSAPFSVATTSQCEQDMDKGRDNVRPDYGG